MPTLVRDHHRPRDQRDRGRGRGERSPRDRGEDRVGGEIAAATDPRRAGSLGYVGHMSLPPDENRVRPDHLPTPFSATDIRAGCPLGRTIQIRSEAPGDEPTFRQIRFVEVDIDGAVQEFQPTDSGGLPIGEPTRHRSSWLDLQQHASQPASATVIDEVDLALPFGTETCWRYTVSGRDECVTSGSQKAARGCPFRLSSRWVGSS